MSRKSRSPRGCSRKRWAAHGPPGRSPGLTRPSSASRRPARGRRFAALSRATARTEDLATLAADKGLRAWRAGVVVKQLAGHALVDDATGALREIELSATFTAKRDGRDLEGAVDVRGTLTDVGATAAIAAPAAEELALRQRTVPEQRELLGGLPSTRPLPGGAAQAGRAQERRAHEGQGTMIDKNGDQNGDAAGNEPELIVLPGGAGKMVPGELDHLSANRRFIVQRSLLATAVGGVIPLPVMDEYLAGRVKAGMLALAERRQVDLAPSSAELLGDPRGGTAMRNATLTAATLLALKLAWRKFFAVLAVGRRAEEMASTFQLGTLFDHYCTKMHVGAGLDCARAIELREIMHAALAEAERTAVVNAFREGSRVLGQTMLEAPAWANSKIERAARRWSHSGGTSTDPIPGLDDDGAPADATTCWLDRASTEVEGRLGLGQEVLVGLVRTPERRAGARRRTRAPRRRRRLPERRAPLGEDEGDGRPRRPRPVGRPRLVATAHPLCYDSIR